MFNFTAIWVRFRQKSDKKNDALGGGLSVFSRWPRKVLMPKKVGKNLENPRGRNFDERMWKIRIIV